MVAAQMQPMIEPVECAEKIQPQYDAIMIKIGEQTLYKFGYINYNIETSAFW